jgi:outer membrane protein insertion porin family
MELLGASLTSSSSDPVFKNRQISGSILFLLFGLLSFAWLHTPAQAQTGKSYKILDIIVEGNEYVERTTIIALSGLRKGDEIVLGDDNLLQTDAIQDAIRNLWSRKQFSSVGIVPDKITPLGIFIKIIVEEFPRLDEVVIEGNEDFDDNEIRDEISKYRGDILRDKDAFDAAEKIRALYAEDGRPFTKVRAEVAPVDSSNFAKLLIFVEEGADFYVRSINFDGNEKFPDEDLESALDETSTKSWWQIWRSDAFDLEEYATSKENLLVFYRRNGYVDAAIVNDSVNYDEAEEAVDIYIEVSEGDQVFVRNIKFEGNLAYPDEFLERRLDFIKGDVFNEERFTQNLSGNESQTDVASLYLDNGYLTVEPTPELRRIGPDSMDITIKIIERNRFTVRRVNIEGNSKTHDKVIRRELFTRPGEYFSRSAIIRSIRALGVLNYFNPEALQPRFDRVNDDQVDITYTVEERSNDTFNASVGFAGQFGVTGSIGITLNNFSITEPLTGGAGQQFRFEYQFGGSNSLQTFTLGFTEPWLLDEPTTVGFNLFRTRQRATFDVRRTGISINAGRRVFWPDDFFRMDYQFRFLQNEIFNDGLGNDLGTDTEFSIRQIVSRTNLDNLIFPSEGSRFTFSNQLALGALNIGTTDYLRTDITYEMFNPLMQVNGQNRLVLYLSTNMGYVTGISSDTTIPPTEFYRMGGNGLGGFAVTPLRGYEDEQIGPRNGRGQLTGGKFMLRHVAEMRFALSLDPMPIYFLGFAEAGNVWNGLSDSDPFQLKRSAGLGLRILLQPLGLLGFDYGYGFDPPVGDVGDRSGWKFHFQFGR